jgi:rhamnulokinase
LLSEVRAGLRKATSSHPEIATVGVDSWGVDFGLLDMSGNLVTAPYCYRDAGVDGMMEAVFDRILRPDIYARTGTQFLAFNSLYRLLSIAIESPEHLDRAHKLLMIADLVHHELTGNPVCEFTNATTSQFYNPALDGWDTELLRDLDIPTHFLPDIVRPGSDLGLLLPDVAADTGARNLHVVAPATHDTGSAVAAVPFESADAGTGAYISCGTWALVGCERTEPLISDAALHHNFTNEGGAFGTWRFLKNVAGLWLLEECRRVWAREHIGSDYGALLSAAEQAEPFRSLIDPDDASFTAPGDMPTRITDYCRKTRQPLPESEGDIVRCILESLALKFRIVLDEMASVTGRNPGVIHIVGGGSRNHLLCEWTAGATGRPVVTGPVEATAIGNLLLSSGRFNSLSELRSIVRNSFPLDTFDPAPSQPWDDACGRLKSLLQEPSR